MNIDLQKSFQQSCEAAYNRGANGQEFGINHDPRFNQDQLNTIKQAYEKGLIYAQEKKFARTRYAAEQKGRKGQALELSDDFSENEQWQIKKAHRKGAGKRRKSLSEKVDINYPINFLQGGAIGLVLAFFCCSVIFTSLHHGQFLETFLTIAIVYLALHFVLCKVSYYYKYIAAAVGTLCLIWMFKGNTANMIGIGIIAVLGNYRMLKPLWDQEKKNK